jgi:hypothetical protein
MKYDKKKGKGKQSINKFEKQKKNTETPYQPKPLHVLPY